MNSPLSDHSKREFIEHTLLDLRDGHASEEDISKLQALLMSDRAARLIYLRANQLASMLETRSTETEGFVPTVARFRIQRSHLVSAFLGAGIAAALALLAYFNPLSHSDHQTGASADEASPRPYASLFSDYDAVIGGSPATLSQGFGEGELALDRGIAQLAFRNGAQIVLEGECGFEIIDEMTVTLTHGKMWAHCPESAYGFKVLTPGGREIIDLGTEFGVEVTASGATDVHVFDGLVDVISLDSTPQRLSAGSALSWATADAAVKQSAAEPDKFVSADSLASKRFLAYRDHINSRNDLLLYYDFANRKRNRCRNIVANSSNKSHGLIRGATTVRGRFNGSKSLQFESPGDRVELEMDHFDDLPGFSAAVWLKIERFDSYNATIFNSNNWDPGAIHFQINNQGRLKSGINGGPSVQSKPGCVSPGKWHFVAMTWNFETKEAQLFCDGLPISLGPGPSSPQLVTFAPQFGPCQIGAWTETRDYKNGRDLESPRTSREFRGRIDEVMIFDHDLSAEEIADLYAIGAP